jgi:hypothetical protein
VSSYFVAKTVVDVVTQLWGPTLFCVIVYPTIGYQGLASKFFVYWAFMLLEARHRRRAVSGHRGHLSVRHVELSVLLEISRLYGGFFTSPLQMNDHESWRFADALSSLKYTFMGVAVNELTDLQLSCTSAQVSQGTCIATGNRTYSTGTGCVRCERSRISQILYACNNHVGFQLLQKNLKDLLLLLLYVQYNHY